MDEVDLAALRLDARVQDHDASPTLRPGERFLGKRMPWSWLTAAARCPGRALHVALALWHQASLTKCWTVVMNSDRLRELGVDRYAAARGLGTLEALGLVRVERAQGRKPRVTLLRGPARPERQGDEEP